MYTNQFYKIHWLGLACGDLTGYRAIPMRGRQVLVSRWRRGPANEGALLQPQPELQLAGLARFGFVRYANCSEMFIGDAC